MSDVTNGLLPDDRGSVLAGQRSRRSSRRCGTAARTRRLTIILLLATHFSAVDTRGTDRLIDQQPFDQLTLKDEGKVFKLMPLEMAKREPIREQDRGEWLVVRLVQRPDQRYEIRWRDIERLQLFEELILEEAARLEEAGVFDQAHENYNFLRQKEAGFPGLAAARNRCLFREAEFWLGQARYDTALVLLNELYRQDERYPELKELSGRVVERLSQELIAAGNHAAARELLAELSAKYVGHEVVAAGNDRLAQLAHEWYDKARLAAEEERWREAHNLVRQALTIWPDLSLARQLASDLNRDYPIVHVGVREAWTEHSATVPASWSARRCQQLVERHLFEPVSFGEDGGTYDSSVSSFTTQELRTLLSLESRATWPHNGQLVSSLDVVSHLLRLGRSPDSPIGRSLNLAVASISVREANSLEIVWRRDIPWWPALMQVPIIPWDRDSGVSDDAPGWGPYRRTNAGGDARGFSLQQDYSEAGDQQPREIIETTYRDVISALSALRERRIDVIDRVAPWELPLARSNTDLRLVRYAAPTVHLLLPNPASPWMASGLVRRAVARSLDRELILREIMGDAGMDEGSLLTGPFPVGYACDQSTGEYPRDPRLAATLLNSRVHFAKDQLKGRPIRLVHPGTDIARRAARAIQAQLQLDGLGWNVVLHESSTVDLCQGPGCPWDLWYVQWYAMEPWTDAEILLGPLSVLSPVQPRLAKGLDDLNKSTTREEAIAALHEIDRHVAASLAVIPLWQINEYAAIHRSLEGIPERPVSLYQNIRQWRMTREP